MTFIKIIVLVGILLFFCTPVSAQLSQNTEPPFIVEKQNFKKHKYNIGHASDFKSTNWQQVIDKTWGSGLPTAEKLAIFDTFWESIHHNFACFQDLDVDWNKIKQTYRTEIEEGISRGRFAAIMNHCAMALRESHTYADDSEVNYQTALTPGIPILNVGGWGQNGHFGAGLTPLPDSSLLVYDAVDDHPLGLVPGDVVLGYDGIPWKQLYKQLIKEQLPISGFWWGSSQTAFEHSWLMSAGMNWHLFNTIDILKYASGDTLHLSTQPLVDKEMSIFCTEQMDIPGIPKPDYDNQELVGFGIIDGTDIGYIYVWGWFWEAEEEFYTAVQELMFEEQISGLVIDFRMNYGGNMFLSYKATSLLFNSNDYTIGFAERSDDEDHQAMAPSPDGDPEYYRLAGDFRSYFDKPVAVLVGAGAISSGDQVALRMTYHPMAKTFGKSTSAAFNAPTGLDLGDNDWNSRYAIAEAYFVKNPQHFITRVEFPVDEYVWLTKDDVAKGEDTVVKKAISWINNKVYPHSAIIDSKSPRPGSKLTTHVLVENPNDHMLQVEAYLFSTDSVAMDTVYMTHEKSKTYSGEFLLNDFENDYYLSYKTTNFEEKDVQVLPAVNYFSTKGPVKINDMQIVSTDTIPQPGDFIRYEVTLSNNGAESTVHNVNALFRSLDPCSGVNMLTDSIRYGDIKAGETAFSNQNITLRFSPDCSSLNIAFVGEFYSNGIHFWSDTFYVDLITSLASETNRSPLEFRLEPNFPNPFNPETTINYQLSKKSHIDLSIFNMLGQKVRTLVSKKQQEGRYQITWSAVDIPSGVYLLKMKTDKGFTETRKLVLLK